MWCEYRRNPIKLNTNQCNSTKCSKTTPHKNFATNKHGVDRTVASGGGGGGGGGRLFLVPPTTSHASSGSATETVEIYSSPTVPFRCICVKMASYFLAVPLKRTWEADLIKPLKTFISDTYTGSNSEDFDQALIEFNKLRNSTISKSMDKHESALEVLYRYLCCIIGLRWMTVESVPSSILDLVISDGAVIDNVIFLSPLDNSDHSVSDFTFWISLSLILFETSDFGLSERLS